MRTLRIIHYPGLTGDLESQSVTVAKLSCRKTAESGSKKLLLMEKNIHQSTQKAVLFFL